MKNLDNISDASKGLKTFDRVTGTVKVSKSAVDTAKAAKSATVGTWVVNNGDALLDTSRTIKPAKEYVKQADGGWKAVNKVDDVASPRVSPVKPKLTADDIVFSDKFKKPTYENQPAKRGWTNQKIADTINNPVKTTTSLNKETGNTVTNYYINDTHYVAVDDVTGKVIQIADLTKKWKGPE